MKLSSLGLARLRCVRCGAVAGYGAGREGRRDAGRRRARHIGDKKLEALKTLRRQAQMQRNVGSDAGSSTDVECPARAARQVSAGRKPRAGMGGMTWHRRSTGFNADPARRRKRWRWPRRRDGVSHGPGGRCSRTATKPTPEQLEQMTTRMCAAATRGSRRALMLGWFATAHPALQRELYLRRRSRVARRQGLRHRRQERRRLRGAALHRSTDAPAADGHLQGTAAAHGHERAAMDPVTIRGRAAAAGGHETTRTERRRDARSAQAEIEKQIAAMRGSRR